MSLGEIFLTKNTYGQRGGGVTGAMPTESGTTDISSYFFLNSSYEFAFVQNL